MTYQEKRDKRIEGLINREDLRKFRTAIIDIAQDLEDDGFESGDVREYLENVLKHDLRPYSKPSK